MMLMLYQVEAGQKMLYNMWLAEQCVMLMLLYQVEAGLFKSHNVDCYEMKCHCFKPLFCIFKAELGWKQFGLMR